MTLQAMTLQATGAHSTSPQPAAMVAEDTATATDTATVFAAFSTASAPADGGSLDKDAAAAKVGRSRAFAQLAAASAWAPRAGTAAGTSAGTIEDSAVHAADRPSADRPANGRRPRRR